MEFERGREPAIRIVQAPEAGPGFTIEATPLAVRLHGSVDPGETVDMNTRSAAALAMAIAWFLSESDWETACQIVSRISGPHAPISVALAVGGDRVIISAVSPVGRPWLVSLPRLSAATLRDSLRAVSAVAWDAVTTGGPTVTVTHPEAGPG